MALVGVWLSFAWPWRHRIAAWALYGLSRSIAYVATWSGHDPTGRFIGTPAREQNHTVTATLIARNDGGEQEQ